jgi:hypothetical protein
VPPEQIAAVIILIGGSLYLLFREYINSEIETLMNKY